MLWDDTKVLCELNMTSEDFTKQRNMRHQSKISSATSESQKRDSRCDGQGRQMMRWGLGLHSDVGNTRKTAVIIIWAGTNFTGFEAKFSGFPTLLCVNCEGEVGTARKLSYAL